MATSISLKIRNKQLESENRRLKLELLQRNHQKTNIVPVDEIQLLKDQIAFLMGNKNIKNPEYHFGNIDEMLNFKHKFIETIEKLNFEIENFKNEISFKEKDYQIKLSFLNSEIEKFSDERDLINEEKNRIEMKCQNLKNEVEVEKCKIKFFQSFVKKSEDLLKENSELMAENESKKEIIGFLNKKNDELEQKLNFFIIKDNKNKVVFALREELKRAQEEVYHQAEKIEEFKIFFNEIKNENFALREELDKKEFFYKNLNSKITENEIELKNLNLENDQLREKIEILIRENEEMKINFEKECEKIKSKIKEEVEKESSEELEKEKKRINEKIEKMNLNYQESESKIKILIKENEELKNELEIKNKKINFFMKNNENELLKAMAIEKEIMNNEIEKLKREIKNTDKSITKGLMKIGIVSENLTDFVVNEFIKRDILLKKIGDLKIDYENIPEIILKLKDEQRKFIEDLEKKNRIIKLLKDMNVKLKTIVIKSNSNNDEMYKPENNIKTDQNVKNNDQSLDLVGNDKL
ncbi:hypothetical protein DMUE_2612 [Dictyocoela muelleri]|nr:hypothetical protein DMUE_2612 [Dictyocoela muelleri]